MRSASVVEVEVSGQRLPGIADRFVAVQVDFFVFDRFPESFHKDVISPTTLAVHADLNLVLMKNADKVRTRELAALVGVHDLGRAIFHDGFLQRVDARVGRQAIGQPPAQHLARGPVKHGAQIHKAAAHRNVGRVHRPDVIRAFDGEVAQQIRIDPVRLVTSARIGLAIDRLDAHLSHQRADMLAPDLKAFKHEHVAQHPGAGKRIFQVKLVDAAHQRQIGLGRRLGKVVHR